MLSAQASANSNGKALGEGGPLCVHSFLWAVESVVLNSSQGIKDEICLKLIMGKIKTQ